MQPIYAVLKCGLFVLMLALLTLVSHWLFQRNWGKKMQISGNEFAGILFGAISLLYSLIIAFVIVAVWEDYEELNHTIEQESDKLNNIIAHSAELPDSLKIPLNNSLIHYCTQVLHDWSVTGTDNYHPASALPKFRLSLLRAHPVGQFQENLYEILDDDLSDVSDLRRERLGHVRSHVPTLVWLILLAGTVLIIGFSFFIHTESVTLKRFGISCLSALVGMCIFLVYALDHPFTSSMQVSNEPYKNILLMLQHKSKE